MAKSVPAKTPAFEIEEATIAQLQAAMENKLLSARELVTVYLARIETFDPQLNSFISLNPEAEKIATRLDAARQEGHVYGPLHGIPLVIKDNIDTAELPTTAGSQALSTSQPPDDAFAVARLRAAGAIVLGKANLHELALRGESVSGLGGQVHNPYNLDYTPGGSSGGTAAAIAANLATAGLGSDTLNSVRSPASACNIVGLRPTPGLVSRDGLMPVSLSQDVIGPMGRTVSDVATLLAAIACDDPADPMTARSAGQVPRSYLAGLQPDGLDGKRLGIVRSLYEPSAESGKAVASLMDDALTVMQGLGAQCFEVPAAIDPELMLKELSLVKWEAKLHLNHYLAALGARSPIKDFDELLLSGKAHPSIVPLLKDLKSVETPLGDAEYWQRMYQRRVELRERLDALFGHQQLDALVYPHQRQLVARIGESQAGRNGFVAAASGFPAITLPAGFSDEGLPVGIELMAKPFQETLLLKMAYAYEQATHWRRQPALE